MFALLDGGMGNTDYAATLLDPDLESSENSALSDADRSVLERAMSQLSVATPVLDAVETAGADARAALKWADPAGVSHHSGNAVRWIDAIEERTAGAGVALDETVHAAGEAITHEQEWQDLFAERDDVASRVLEVTEYVLGQLAVNGVADEDLTGTPGERILSAGLGAAESALHAETARLLLEAGDTAGIAELLEEADADADVLIRLTVAQSAPLLLEMLPPPGDKQAIRGSFDVGDSDLVDASVDVGLVDGKASARYTERGEDGEFQAGFEGSRVKAGLESESGMDANVSYDIASGKLKGGATLARDKDKVTSAGETLEPAGWAEGMATDDDRTFHQGNETVQTETDKSLGMTTDFESLGLTADASRSREYADGSSRAWGMSGGAKIEGFAITELSLGANYSRTTSTGASWGGSAQATRTDENNLHDIDSAGQASAESGYDVGGTASVGIGGLASLDVGGGYRSKESVEGRTLRGMEGSEYVEQSEEGAYGSVGLRSGVGGLYGTRESVEIGGRVIHFDSTPEGAKARRFYNRFRTLPPGGEGYRIKSTTTGDADRSGSVANIAGFSVGQMSETRATQTSNEDGSTVGQQTGTNALSGAVPLLGTTVSHLNALQKTTSAAGSMFVGTTHVDDREAGAAHGGLRDATGGASDLDEVLHDPDGKASGKWTVQTAISESEIDGFIEIVLDREIAGVDILPLRAALVGARNRDEKHAAVLEWTSRRGSDALKRLRAYAKGTDFVELEGDPYLTGMKGQLEFEDQLSDYVARASDPTTDKGSLLADIRSMIGYQEMKRTALEDRERYPDLPGPLRRSELERTRNSLLGLEQARTTALVMMGADPDQAAGVSLAGASVDDERWLRKEKFRMLEARDEARRGRWVHDGGDVEMGAFRDEPSAYAKYGESLSYSGYYAIALDESVRGERSYDAARKREADYYALEFPRTEEERKGQLSKLNAVGTHYQSGRQAFEKAVTWFDFIRDAVGPKDPLMHGYRKKRAPDTFV